MLMLCGSGIFSASCVERCEKTSIHMRDTLQVAPLLSGVMERPLEDRGGVDD